MSRPRDLLEDRVQLPRTEYAALLHDRERLTQVEQENRVLRKQVEPMVKTIHALMARVEQLEVRLAKDSHNSGKPPSSDGYAKKPRTKGLRTPGQNPSGGQKGHPGQTLARVAHPDEVVRHPAIQCQQCGQSLGPVVVDHLIKRQVFDLPPQRLQVTEHQAEAKMCPCCGHPNTASFPAPVKAPAQYGPAVLALAVYLLYGQHLPYERTHTLLQELFHVSLSEATIQTAAQTCQQAIGPSVVQTEENLCAASVTHHDETGMRVEGKLQWVHVMSTDVCTRLWVDPHRGGEGIHALHLLDGRVGKTLVHDAFSAYFGVPGVHHQLCNVHILRDLMAMTEAPFHQPWAKDMAELLLEIKAAVDKAKPKALPQEEVATYNARYAATVARGFAENPERPPVGKKSRGPTKRTEPQRLLHRLQNHQEEHLRFMVDSKVPFDNNQAERDLRMVKLQQKISGSFRTFQGARRFADIRSYVSTAHKHGQSVLHVLQQALLQRPWIPPPYGAT